MATLEELSKKDAQFFLKVSKRECNPEEKKPKELRLDLNPILTKENVLAAENIHVKGKLLVFEDARDTVQVDLWALLENRPPLIFRDVDVQRGYDLNEEIHKYLLVRPVTPGKAMNKRAAFRVKVGMPCKVYAHNAGATYQGVVKDVSSAGFAVEIGNHFLEEKIPNRDSIVIEFSDPMFDNKKITVEGSLVRRDRGRIATLFGCQCRDVGKDYLNYVMKKQTAKAHA